MHCGMCCGRRCCSTHRDNLPERLPLSRQKEFKQIKNMVIQEAVRLGELSAVFRSEKISDEPEDDPVPKGEQRLWPAGRRYREAKKILYDGETPPEEKRAALAKLEQLYDGGFSVAAHLLGKAYLDGVGVKADEKAAERWFYKAAAAGNGYSEYALGKLLEQQERFTEAAGWHRKAAEQNNQYAQYRLASCCSMAKKFQRTRRKLSVCSPLPQGRITSMRNIRWASCIFSEKRYQKTGRRPVYWFTQSAEQGSEYAKYFLKHLDDWRKAAISQGVGRLLHHLGTLFPAVTTRPCQYPADH